MLIYCKPGVSQLKLEHADKPFGLASYIQTFKNHIRPTGDSKIHVTACENISASKGKIYLWGRPRTRFRILGLFLEFQSQQDLSLVRLTNLGVSQQNLQFQIHVFMRKAIARRLINFHRCTWKMWNLNLFSKFLLWTWNLNDFVIIQMWSLSLTVFNHKTSAKCNTFMTSLLDW
jgi:hypothetical protein